MDAFKKNNSTIVETIPPKAYTRLWKDISKRKCTMNKYSIQRTRRCPRNPLLFNLAIILRIWCIPKLTHMIVNEPVLITARCRRVIRTTAKATKDRTNVIASGSELSKRPKLSGSLDNKSLAFQNEKPFKVYKTTSSSYFYAATSWYITRTLLTIVNLCRNLEIVIIFANSSKLCNWYKNNRSLSLIKIMHSIFINSILIPVNSDRDHKRTHISARIGYECIDIPTIYESKLQIGSLNQEFVGIGNFVILADALKYADFFDKPALKVGQELVRSVTKSFSSLCFNY